MNCNPLRWLWGIVPLALLGLFFYTVERGRIEEDLSSRAKSALQAAGIGWATPTFKGRDGLLIGTSMNEDERLAALAAVAGTPGVRLVEDRTELSSLVSPFTWAARRDGDNVVLSGFVPGETEREAVINSLRGALKGVKIEDKLLVGRGVPALEAWVAGTSFAVKQLAGLKQGEVSLKDLDLSVRGTAADKNTFAAIKKALGKLPRGVKLVDNVVDLASPNLYEFAARFASGKLTLEGFVPTEKSRSALIAAAKAKYKNVIIDDQLVVAAGGPAGFEQASRAVVDQLSRLKSGAGRVRSGGIDLSGEAIDEATAAAIASDLKKAIPVGFKPAPAIEFPKIIAVSPYLWSADFQKGLVVVDGFVQSEPVRRSVLAELNRRLPGVVINDRMKVGPSAISPEAWQSAISYSVDQLSRLENGRVEIVDDRLTISGLAANEGAEKAVKSALLATPRGFSLKGSKIERKLEPVVEKPKVVIEAPYAWRGVVNGEQVVLDGDVPNEDLRKAIVAYAEERFKGRSVIDRMVVRKGAPVNDAGWLNAMRSGLRSLALVGIGTAELQNADLVVSGLTKTPGVPDRVARILDASIPDGFKGRANIIYRGPSEAELKKQAADRAAQEQVRLGELDKKRQQTEKKRKDEEAARVRAEQDAKAKVEAANKKKADDEAKAKVAAEKKRADDEAKAKAASEKKRADDAAKAKIEAARKKADDEAAAQAAAERDRKAAEEARIKAEADRKQAERERLRSEQDATLRADAEQRKRILKQQTDAEARAYVFSARYTGAAIVLEGVVPSDEVRYGLLALVRRNYPLRKITDRTKVRTDAPTDWRLAAELGLKQLSQLENGQLTLRDRLVFISGATDQSSVLEKVRANIVKQVPKGFKGDEIVVLVAPPPPEIKERDFSAFDVDKLLRGSGKMSNAECEAVLNVVTRRVKALFRPSRAELDKQGEVAVKTLAKVIPRCPSKRITIAGHTDSDGASGYNQQLSEDRAATVVQVLIDNGVDQGQLQSEGFGERQPVAINDTAANKAKNRRIEFSVAN